MIKFKYAVLAVSISILLGCDDLQNKKIDGSSDQSLKSSMADISKALPESEKEDFSKYLMLVSLKHVNIFSPTVEVDMRNALNGKTAREIIEEGKNIEIEKKKEDIKRESDEKKMVEIKKLEKIERDKEKIQELEKEIELQKLIKDKLEQIKFSDAKFRILDNDFMKEAVLSFTISNYSDEVLKTVYAKGTLISDGRTLPWFEDNFNFNVSGGLEKGETRTFNLTPNLLSSWSNVNAPEDAKLFITINGIENANSEKINIISMNSNIKDLDELKSKYN